MSSSESHTKPDLPWLSTSGTEPLRSATTGVPLASDSIITRPNGSGQSIGNSVAAAPAKNSGFSDSPISPTNSMSDERNSGSITVCQ